MVKLEGLVFCNLLRNNLQIKSVEGHIIFTGDFY